MKKIGYLFLLHFFVFYGICSYAQEKTCQDLKNPNVWIWPNAHKLAQLENEAQTLYILQGNFSRTSKTFKSLGVAPHPVQKKLVLVYRLQALPSSKDLLQTFLIRAESWKNRGSEVLGLQVDFDSPTLKLKKYSDFLLKIRHELPADFSFSITGLTDWINKSDTFQKALIDQNIAVFYQFYQERIPHVDSKREIQSLSNYKIPFYIGLLPTQIVPEEEITKLQANKNYKGTICFYGEKI